LFLGRSLDSPKRAGSANRITIGWSGEEPALEEYHTNGEVLDTVCVRDLVVTLARELSPKERVVLTGLADGLALREVASNSRLSYPTALKYRRRIAALTVKFGIGTPRSPRKAFPANKKPERTAGKKGSLSRT